MSRLTRWESATGLVGCSDVVGYVDSTATRKDLGGDAGK